MARDPWYRSEQSLERMEQARNRHAPRYLRQRYTSELLSFLFHTLVLVIPHTLLRANSAAHFYRTLSWWSHVHKRLSLREVRSLRRRLANRSTRLDRPWRYVFWQPTTDSEEPSFNQTALTGRRADRWIHRSQQLFYKFILSLNVSTFSGSWPWLPLTC